MDDLDENMTPEELDDLLSELQSGEGVEPSRASADVTFLRQLVHTAHSADIHKAFSAQLGERIHQALNLKPISRVSRLSLAGHFPSAAFGSWFSTASLFRHVTLALTTAILLLGFVTLSMLTWSYSGQAAHALTFTPDLSDNLVLTPAHALTSQNALSTDRASIITQETARSASRATIALRAIQAPLPPATPIPGSVDVNVFTVTPFNQ